MKYQRIYSIYYESAIILSTMLVLILQIRKLRHRKVKQLSKSYRVVKPGESNSPVSMFLPALNYYILKSSFYGNKMYEQILITRNILLWLQLTRLFLLIAISFFLQVRRWMRISKEMEIVARCSLEAMARD